MKDGKLKVALAGLGFGKAFVPIWCKHPDVYEVDIKNVNGEKVSTQSIAGLLESGEFILITAGG